MFARLPSVLVLVVMALLPAPLWSAEEILRFDSEIEVAADATMLVTERITVRAEGKLIRRGIYRDFPTDYRDALGNRYIVGFSVVAVARDGYSEAYFTESYANGVRVYIGDSNRYLDPGVYQYEITYTTTRQLGFFATHDELYWNVTGNGWGFPINAASAVVTLPEGVAADSISTTAYTGSFGTTGRSFQAEVSATGKAHFATTEALAPAEGLTIVVSWPKGFVAEPSWLQRLRWLLSDNRSLLIALLVLLINAVYLWRVWLRFGVDPEAGPLFPRYAPPENISPGACRYIREMAADNRAFTAAVMNLAVHGYLRIHEGLTAALQALTGESVYEKSIGQLSPLQRKLLSPVLKWADAKIDNAYADTFLLQKLDAAAATAPLGLGEKAVLRSLFAGQDLLLLSNANHKVIGAAVRAHAKALRRYYQTQHFKTNGILAIPAVVAAAVGFLGVSASETVAVLPMLLLFANVPLIIVALRLLRAPTLEGRRILDAVEGFTEYLRVAEADDLARVSGVAGPRPERTVALFERYLPYAIAFDVDQPWAAQFEDVFARISIERGQGYRPVWYNSRGSINSFSSIATNMSSSLNTAISSSAAPPGSSSGGGGGSSGGGGGGGGGGW